MKWWIDVWTKGCGEMDRRLDSGWEDVWTKGYVEGWMKGRMDG